MKLGFIGFGRMGGNIDKGVLSEQKLKASLWLILNKR